MNNLVSIIIPVYNVEKYLPQCIESVLNQTYKNLEIILVDDGSHDNCGKICDDYAESDRRIKVIHKQNGGVASARNAGKSAAHGEWIYFIDSDDWIESNAVEKMMNYASDDIDAVFCDYFNIGEKNYTEIKLKYDTDSPLTVNIDHDDYSSLITYLNSKPVVWNGIFRKNKVDTINFCQNVGYADDLLFKFECFTKINKYVYLPALLYYYRITPNSYTHSYKDYMTEMFFSLYNELFKIIKKYNYPYDSQKYVNSLILSNLIVIANNILNKENKISLLRKYRKLKDIINNDLYCQAINCFDKNTLNHSAKIYTAFDHLNCISVMIVSVLNRIYNKIKVNRLQ